MLRGLRHSARAASLVNNSRSGALQVRSYASTGAKPATPLSNTSKPSSVPAVQPTQVAKAPAAPTSSSSSSSSGSGFMGLLAFFTLFPAVTASSYAYKDYTDPEFNAKIRKISPKLADLADEHLMPVFEPLLLKLVGRRSVPAPTPEEQLEMQKAVDEAVQAMEQAAVEIATTRVMEVKETEQDSVSSSSSDSVASASSSSSSSSTTSSSVSDLSTHTDSSSSSSHPSDISAVPVSHETTPVAEEPTPVSEVSPVSEPAPVSAVSVSEIPSHLSAEEYAREGGSITEVEAKPEPTAAEVLAQVKDNQLSQEEILAAAEALLRKALGAVEGRDIRVETFVKLPDDKYYGVISELKTLDQAKLKIHALMSELEQRSQEEGIRLQEALKKQRVEDSVKLIEAVQQQDQRHKELMDQLVAAKDEETAEKIAAAIHREKLNFAEYLTKRLRDNNDLWEEKLQQSLNSLTLELEAKAAQNLVREREVRLARVERMQEQVQKLDQALKRATSSQQVSHSVHKLSLAMLALQGALDRDVPIAAQLDDLAAAAKGDELVELTVRALPHSVFSLAKRGIPTVSQLQGRFERVYSEARKASLVPAGSGVVGHMAAQVFNSLLFTEKHLVEGSEQPQALLSSAAYFLDRGDLEQAVRCVEKLKGLPASVAKDWLEEARSRVALEKSLKAIHARVSVLCSQA